MGEAGCCEFTKDRARTGGEKPGALWHIFDALDADFDKLCLIIVIL